MDDEFAFSGNIGEDFVNEVVADVNMEEGLNSVVGLDYISDVNPSYGANPIFESDFIPVVREADAVNDQILRQPELLPHPLLESSSPVFTAPPPPSRRRSTNRHPHPTIVCHLRLSPPSSPSPATRPTSASPMILLRLTGGVSTGSGEGLTGSSKVGFVAICSTEVLVGRQRRMFTLILIWEEMAITVEYLDDRTTTMEENIEEKRRTWRMQRRRRRPWEKATETKMTVGESDGDGDDYGRKRRRR
ncbi:hypothetical protein Ccrd_024925 [Cynara cardunculus var. scolymus]|uniref:Uncharacterized protein n=1 Tax=Cynara cardunculus var. scolymus TaxID=59895 RepID=A0A103XBQ8_CYNCS|nr:hypothetical protein Ccrd_024925 [Cynara cardunculus var. scolymus]